MDKVKETPEAAKAKQEALQVQITEMEQTVRIITNLQSLIDNGTFVGRVRGVLSESWDWCEGMRTSIQRQVDLMKAQLTTQEGEPNGKKESPKESDNVVGINHAK